MSRPLPTTPRLPASRASPKKAAAASLPLPDLTHIWLFGQAPANGLKLYYHSRPAALTDSALSIPDALKDKFHLDVFAAKVKEVYEYRNSNCYDALGTLKAYVVGLLAQIEAAHSIERRDKSGRTINVIF